MRRYLFYCLLLCFSPPTLAEKNEHLYDIEFDGPRDVGDIKEWEFREDVIDLPAYPSKDKLIEVQIDAPDASFKYYLDTESIQRGIDHVAVRVTSVIESQSGYQNVFFEGYRCDTREYVTYAYGTGKNKFYEMSDPQWKVIKQRGGTGLDYRRDYITAYLCDSDRNSLPKDEILSRIRYPDTIPSDSGGF